MLAEIALKNMLMMISKRNEERALFDIVQDRTGRLGNKRLLDAIKDMDIKEFMDEINLYKDIIHKKEVGKFRVLYWKVLPYNVPMAVQTPMSIYKDMDGNEVNDVYSKNPHYRIQYLHLCVFPIEQVTVVLLFHHIRDKNYRSIRHWLNSVSDDKRLQYINYLIFAYTENYFISKTIKETLEKNNDLIKLSQESNGLPHLGLLNQEEYYLNEYHPVTMESIPNFLSEEYALLK